MKLLKSLGALALAGLATTTFAQTPYITGAITDGNWDPGVAVPYGGGVADDLLLVDNGSGLWSKTLTQAALGVGTDIATDTNVEWKVAGPGFSNPNTPSNVKLRVPSTNTDDVTFNWQETAVGDGFFPDENFAYHSLTRSIVDGGTSIELVGNFQATAFTPGDPDVVVLTDGDNDGIYIGTVTGLAGGSYTAKIVVDDFATYDFGTDGAGGGDIGFDVIDAASTITVELDANTGRHRITDDQAVAAAPNTIYGVSAAWSTAYDTATELVEVSPNIFQKTFTVATPGDYKVRVGVSDAASDVTDFPSSNGYPFTTTAASQQVVVTFDRRTYSDGYLPSTDIVSVVDATTSLGLNDWTEVQAVGNWMDEAGGAGDWNANDNSFNLTESATHDVYRPAVPYTMFLDSPGSLEGKVVLRTATITGDWNIQAGGEGDGLTLDGNNPTFAVPDFVTNDVLHVAVDTITGRVNYSVNSAPADPDRASYISGGAATSVSNWTLWD